MATMPGAVSVVRPYGRLIFYLHDEEDIPLSRSINLSNKNRSSEVSFVLKDYGYSPKTFGPRRPHHWLFNKWEGLCPALETALEVVRDHTDHLPRLVPTGLIETSFSITGPITRQYTVANETIPRDTIAGMATVENNGIYMCIPARRNSSRTRTSESV
jgi:hypothetical protein